MPTRPSATLLVTIGATLVVALAGATVLGVTGGVHPVHLAIICWLVLAYALSGLVAWRLRPASNLGPLMVLAGTGALAGALSWADEGSVLHTIGQAVDVLPLVLFVQVFLTYPSGRLHGRVERLIVVTGWVAAL